MKLEHFFQLRWRKYVLERTWLVLELSSTDFSYFQASNKQQVVYVFQARRVEEMLLFPSPYFKQLKWLERILVR